ncbi:MAG: glycosyltransferase [Bacteroidetes bacterium]|nr:glycosyltransferase [Bacteroidota bacterium]
MALTFEILSYVFVFILLCYVILIGTYNISWFKIKTWKSKITEPHTKVTVIVPARNESENISACLKNICSQNYPADLFEIIIVNDSSTDNTAELVNDFIKTNSNYKISFIEHSGNKNSGKKQAITEAIKVAQGDLIITTDADCVMNTKWIASVVEYYETYKPAMIIGPVKFYNEKGFFQKIQSVEFLSLIASGAASVQIGAPIMCNGANLAYERKIFTDVSGYSSPKNYASGDDVFLMHKIKKFTDRKIAFIKCKDAFVETKAQNTFRDFVNQRKRWVSKSVGYTDFATIASAFIVLLLNLFLVISFILTLFFNEFQSIFVIIFVSKFIIDFPILLGALSFAGKIKNLYFFLPLQLIYPLYIIGIGIAGLFGKFEWKNRKY